MARTIIVRISFVGAVVSLLAMIVAFSLPTSFLLRLALWFAFFLFGFHWYFGSMRALSVTRVRIIDYVYLGVAALGVFVLALNYSEKRDAYSSAQDLERFASDLSAARLEVSHTAIALEAEACRPFLVNLLPMYCEPAKQLKSDLQNDPSMEQIDAAVGKYLEVAKPPSPTDNEKVLAYGALNRLTDMLTSLQRSVKLHTLFIELQQPLPPDPLDYPYGLFTWPFILVLALALRITKTTIEVLEWTSPAPVLPIVTPVEEPLPEIGPSPPPWVGRGRG